MLYKVSCPICGKVNEVEVDDTKLSIYKAGLGKVQDLFPELSADERELIQSGICSQCWSDMYDDKVIIDDIDNNNEDKDEDEYECAHNVCNMCTEYGQACPFNSHDCIDCEGFEEFVDYYEKHLDLK